MYLPCMFQYYMNIYSFMLLAHPKPLVVNDPKAQEDARPCSGLAERQGRALLPRQPVLSQR